MDFFFSTAARPMPVLLAGALLGVIVLFASEHVNAQQSASIAIAIKDHRFQPAQVNAPANRPLSIKVTNLDATPMEFESVSLRVEKVIASTTAGIVNVRALAPGRYEFFDDFHPEARGVLTVQ